MTTKPARRSSRSPTERLRPVGSPAVLYAEIGDVVCDRRVRRPRWPYTRQARPCCEPSFATTHFSAVRVPSAHEEYGHPRASLPFGHPYLVDKRALEEGCPSRTTAREVSLDYVRFALPGGGGVRVSRPPRRRPRHASSSVPGLAGGEEAENARLQGERVAVERPALRATAGFQEVGAREDEAAPVREDTGAVGPPGSRDAAEAEEEGAGRALPLPSGPAP